MKISKSTILYSLICNAMVSTMLCLTASLVANNFIDPKLFFINLAVGYVIASLIGIFFPLVEIGKKFTRCFKVEAITFTGNRFYRYLAVLAITLVYFVFVSPSLAILNYFLIPEQTVYMAFIGWCKNIMPLLSVGYISSLVADYFTYHLIHKFDPSF